MQPRFLLKYAHLPTYRIVEAVMADLNAFCQGARDVDDATLVVVKRSAVLDRPDPYKG